MGGSSPTVFHTAPPQPASKARTTLYALSVGGAEASQNGLGLLMPTKLLVRSAMLGLLFALRRSRRIRHGCDASQPFVDGDRRTLSVLDRLHRQVASAEG